MSRLNQFIVYVGAPVITSLAILIWICLQIRSRFRESDDLAESTHEMLTQYRELHDRGELSDEEFRLIKSRLANSLNGGSQHTQK